MVVSEELLRVENLAVRLCHGSARMRGFELIIERAEL